MQPVKPEPVAVPAIDPDATAYPEHSVELKAKLRAICVGADNIAPVAVVDQVDSAPCPHVEWLEQEGESYACRLSAGHKGKCTRGERIA